jgi:hypothetical protein
MRNAAIDSFFKAAGTVRCSSSPTNAVTASGVSPHSRISDTAISQDTAADDQAGLGAADAGTALADVPRWQQQQGLGQQLGLQQQQQQQWQLRHRKLKAHAQHHRPARKLGAAASADDTAWPGITAALAAVTSGGVAAVDSVSRAAAESGWSVGGAALSSVHPGVWDGRSDTWDLDQAYAADQTEEDWDFTFEYDSGISEEYSGGSSSNVLHQGPVINDSSSISTGGLGSALSGTVDRSAVTSDSSSSSGSSSSALPAEVNNLAACFQPGWVLFIDSGLFFCKSDLQRLLMHKGADLACGWNLQLAKHEPVINSVSNTTTAAAAVGGVEMPGGNSTAVLEAAAEAAQSAAESARAAAVAAVARAQVALAAAQEALATAAASGQAAATDNEAATEAASMVVSTVSASAGKPLAATMHVAVKNVITSSDTLRQPVLGSIVATTAMDGQETKPTAVAAPVAEQSAAQLAADAAYYAGAAPPNYADYALQLGDPSQYSNMVSQPTAAHAGLPGDAAYYAGTDPNDYSYAQEEVDNVDSTSLVGAAAEQHVVVSAADAAYGTTADLADYSYGDEPVEAPAAFGSMSTQATTAPVAAAAYGSTAEQPAAAAALGMAAGAAAMQGAMLLPGTRRRLQQHDMLQQQQQQDMLVGVMSSQDLQALTAQQQQQQQQQQQPVQHQMGQQEQQEFKQMFTPMHASTSFPGALQQQQQPGSPAIPLPPLPALFGLANNDTLSKFPLYYGDAAVGRLVTGRPFDVVPKFAGAHPPTVRRMAAGLPVQVSPLCWR